MKNIKDTITREKAKKLRRNTSMTEKVMWTYLQNRKFKGLRFRRQHPIPPYIVDFVCLSKRIIFELDGEQHEQTKRYDAARTKFLEAKGFKVYRILNADFLYRWEDVYEMLEKLIRS